MHSEEEAIHAWARRKLAQVVRECTLRAADQFDAWARRLRRRVKEEGGRS
jgi:hypothetical protein